MTDNIKLMTGADVGSRLEHLADLQLLWGFGLEILTVGSYHTEQEVKQAHDLEIALELLEIHISLYYPLTSYAKEVNDLPRSAEDIPEDDRQSWFRRNK